MDERILPLAEAFSRRRNRFRELTSAMAEAGWKKGDRLLELGCGVGDGAARMAGQGFIVFAVDKDAGIVEKARARYKGADCTLIHADARALPFVPGSFDGVYAEAAFSGITEKREVIAELRRTLKSGGRMLLCDFAFQAQPTAARERSGIPCLEGAQTMEVYEALYREAGFTLVSKRERFYEFASIVANLCEVYGVTSGEVAGYLAERYGTVKKVGGDVLSGAKLTYCRMIFEKP